MIGFTNHPGVILAGIINYRANERDVMTSVAQSSASVSQLVSKKQELQEQLKRCQNNKFMSAVEKEKKIKKIQEILVNIEMSLVKHKHQKRGR